MIPLPAQDSGAGADDQRRRELDPGRLEFLAIDEGEQHLRRRTGHLAQRLPHRREWPPADCRERCPAHPPANRRHICYRPWANGTRSGTVDPTPLFPFGHGLSYTSFSWDDVQVEAEHPVWLATDGSLWVSMRVTNTGSRAGADIVQLYLHDPVAQVTRPVVSLIGYARVQLQPGESKRVTFEVSADMTSFTGLAGQRIVEPGDIELRLSTSSTVHRHTARLTLVGPERTVGHDRQLTTGVHIG